MADTSINDAIAPGSFMLELGPESEAESSFAPDVLTIVGGKTMGGESLNAEGYVPSSDSPYRAHDTKPDSAFAGTGCFTGEEDNEEGSIATAIDTLESWDVEYGDTFDGTLFDCELK